MHQSERVPIHAPGAAGKLILEQRFSLAVAAALLLLLFALKFPTLPLPYHWDEMGAYVTPAKALAEGGLEHVLTGFRPGPAFFGHPPLLYVTLALTYVVFGFSIVVSHVYVLFWSFLGVFYTYRLGRCLFGRSAGIFAALFLFFTPLYFAQSGMVLGEILIAALGVMAVYYAVQARLPACVLCGIAAVLLKETAAAIPAAIALYAFVFQRHHYGAKWKLLFFALPILVLAAFYLWQKSVTGQWVPNPYFDSHPLGSMEIARVGGKAAWVASFTLFRQYRLLWILLILLAFALNGKAAWKKEYALFTLIGVFVVGAFSLIYFDMRYVLAVLPFLAVAAAGSMIMVLQRRPSQIIIGLFVLVMSASVWREHESGYCNFDYDMQYTDMIAIHKQAADYLAQHYPDARIAAGWPFSSHLTGPWQGYVDRPLNVVGPGDDFELVILGGAVPPVSLREDIVPDKYFEQNYKVLTLYRRNKQRAP